MPADLTFQLSFRATGDTGVLSSSIGSPGFMGGTDVSMKAFIGAGLVVVCFTYVRGGTMPESGAAVDGSVSADMSAMLSRFFTFYQTGVLERSLHLCSFSRLSPSRSPLYLELSQVGSCASVCLWEVQQTLHGSLEKPPQLTCRAALLAELCLGLVARTQYRDPPYKSCSTGQEACLRLVRSLSV